MPEAKPLDTRYEFPPHGRRVDISYRPPDSIVHIVSDGEDWYSVADRYNLPVHELIFANFQTLVPREINYYLRAFVRCDVATADRKNWKFSTSARFNGGPRAGVVYIPLNWREIIAQAKKQTARIVRQWFRQLALTPVPGSVENSALTIFLGAVTGGISYPRGAAELFDRALRYAGAPDELGRAWARRLIGGLGDYTARIQGENRHAFPAWGGPPPHPEILPAAPWPILASTPPDQAFPPRFFEKLLDRPELRSPRAKRAMGRYSLWFDSAFREFCGRALAVKVVGQRRKQLYQTTAVTGLAGAAVGFIDVPNLEI